MKPITVLADLPIPHDPNFVMPTPTAEQYSNPQGQENEALLATGAFDSHNDESEDEALTNEEHEELYGQASS